MPRPCANDLRHPVLHAHERGRTYDQIPEDVGMGRARVGRWLARQRSRGDLAADAMGGPHNVQPDEAARDEKSTTASERDAERDRVHVPGGSRRSAELTLGTTSPRQVWQAWVVGKTGYLVVDPAARQLLGGGSVHKAQYLKREGRAGVASKNRRGAAR